jgi:CBS domain-containing protein
MTAAAKPLLALTAGDLMTRDLLVISEDIPMCSAAQLLLSHQISGAPVVDLAGRLVGVVSTTDFMRATQTLSNAGHGSSERPVACSHQTWLRDPNGKGFTLCDLPLGACSVQRAYWDRAGKQQVKCIEPSGIATDGQIVMLESASADAVKHFMTHDVVTAQPTTQITELARIMIVAGIHRLIIVGDDRKPLGVVSSTDIIAAVAWEQPRAETGDNEYRQTTPRNGATPTVGARGR